VITQAAYETEKKMSEQMEKPILDIA